MELLFAGPPVAGPSPALCGDGPSAELESVRSCATDARRGPTVVRLDPAAISTEAIAAAIEETGYGARRAEA